MNQKFILSALCCSHLMGKDRMPLFRNRSCYSRKEKYRWANKRICWLGEKNSSLSTRSSWPSRIKLWQGPLQSNKLFWVWTNAAWPLQGTLSWRLRLRASWSSTRVSWMMQRLWAEKCLTLTSSCGPFKWCCGTSRGPVHHRLCHSILHQPHGHLCLVPHQLLCPSTPLIPTSSGPRPLPPSSPHLSLPQVAWQLLFLCRQYQALRLAPRHSTLVWSLHQETVCLVQVLPTRSVPVLPMFYQVKRPNHPVTSLSVPPLPAWVCPVLLLSNWSISAPQWRVLQHLPREWHQASLPSADTLWPAGRL